jgi:hypothetical protein
MYEAIKAMAHHVPDMTPEELTRLSEVLGELMRDVKKRQRVSSEKPKKPIQSGPAAVIQQLAASYRRIRKQIEDGFPQSRGDNNDIARDVADPHRTPGTKARGSLASICLASVHDLCDERAKAGNKIRKTRLETLLAPTPCNTSFKGTMKYFIEVNRLGHIDQVTHALSKVGYKLLYLLRCSGSDPDLLGLLLFNVGPLSHVKVGQLAELPKLLEEYREFAKENRGWCGRWLASYQGMFVE